MTTEPDLPPEQNPSAEPEPLAAEREASEPAGSPPPAPPSRPRLPTAEDLEDLIEVPLERGRVALETTWTRLRPMLYTAIVAVVAFGVGLLLFNYIFMPRWVHRGQEARVPDLSNLNVRQAQQVAQPIGLRIVVRGEQFDPDVPKGFILSQDPSAFDVVRRGRAIQVLVSLGEEFASVPVLYGEPRRGAGLLLSRAGLQVGEIVEAHSDELGAGLVLSTEPGAQTVVPRGTTVHVLLSRGSPADDYLMPDLLGRDVRSVKRDLESHGFVVQVAGDTGRLASIVEQIPLPGTRIRRSQVVVLKVAGTVIP
jgi:beta-lactam-binding protein with PASTA domain